ncbi:phage terminase large subunit [Deinococcus cellulosilyticus]|uniref:Terminase n=1 Tax=Deinococcus cellulosilyticus (strain DSM 18568 / NBRC 106333 / KACC 11606 / 5516J-15) TaxID=1223518 RepID=A0A511N491_DEIC1|nr:phage terminase large subunit [Deinococcus cellulosilyticus]GEM47201.1 terminase [Deinococcus cellulosilyticus NBRC 106333 = KACC 11606]
MPVEIRPQPGPQTLFFQSAADIVIYGGAAGGGKSWALLAEPLRHIHNPHFGATLFRRLDADVYSEGGLWDEAMKIYPMFGGVPNGDGYFKFPSGATVSFGHLQHENTKYRYQGAQIPLIELDELTHFTRDQFWYMLSRNRSTCGVRPYVRASTNPDADSWVAEFIHWWIDEEGFAIPDRSGVVRYLLKDGDHMNWGSTPEEVLSRVPDSDPEDVLSVTFISAKLEDNKILMEKDPKYRGRLKAQSFVERARLLGGNWKVRFTAGNVFRRDWFTIISPAQVPKGLRMIRYWDLAATEKKAGNDPDWTTGTLMGVDEHGIYYVLDVVRLRGTPLEVETAIIETAHDDGKRVEIHITQEPGSSGKFVLSHFTRHPELKGYIVKGDRETGSKLERAKPFSAQCEAGNVKVLRGLWNEAWLNELQGFPDGTHDDMVDSASGAFRKLPRAGRIKTKGEAA